MCLEVLSDWTVTMAHLASCIWAPTRRQVGEDKTMTAPGPQSQSVTVASANGDYRRPLAIVTTLFFMWGFLTCLNDILVPHLKSIFELNCAKVMLIQLAFFPLTFSFRSQRRRLWTGSAISGGGDHGAAGGGESIILVGFF
jgi:hypothetical protein